MKLDSEVRLAIEKALDSAAEQHHLYCTPAHLLAALVRDEGPASARNILQEHLGGLRQTRVRPPRVELGQDLRAFLSKEQIARIGGRALVSALVNPGSPLDPDLRYSLHPILSEEHKHKEPANNAREKQEGAEDKSYLRPFDPADVPTWAVEREELSDQLVRILMYGNPLLTGQEGAGKSTLLQLVARRLLQGPVPGILEGREIFFLDPLALIAGTTYRGELEERVQALVQRFRSNRRPPIIFVPELSQLLGSGRQGGSGDLVGAILPALRQGVFQLVGAATDIQLREQIDTSPGLKACLRELRLPDLELAEASLLLKKLPEEWAERFGLSFAQSFVEESIRLCGQYLPHRALPGVARSLMEEATMAHAFESEMLQVHPERLDSSYWERSRPAGNGDGDLDSCRSTPIGRSHLLGALSNLHGIPFEHLDSDTPQRIAGFDEAFQSGIFGQEAARNSVLEAVKVALSGMADPGRPRHSLFFLGPSGTGKTETAGLLARYLMGSEDALLRFNMAEFSESSAVSSLIGSDKGLVGSEEGGRLTEPVLRNPHRIILFDEIEKAHPNVFNIFLSILDKGHCHDKRNVRVSFHHTICIFTSNAGADPTTGLYPTDPSRIKSELSKVFKIEFLNRFNGFVTFADLGEAPRRLVAQRQLELCSAQLQEVHGRRLVWTEAVLDLISRFGAGEPGVRDIIHWVQTRVKPLVCDCLLQDGCDPDRPLVLDCNSRGEYVVNQEVHS
jgi:ATP-dependent Clp protease ATP-binding subunit ClpC